MESARMHIMRQKSQNYPRVVYGELTEILPIFVGKRLERFLRKIDRDPVWPHGCHLWRGGSNSAGYGLIQGCIDYQGYSFLAHRVAWALATDREPGDLLIRHSCDMPLCCNEAHLLDGTHQDNTDDMILRGRAYVGRREGRPLDLLGFDRAVELRFKERKTIAAIAAELGRNRTTIMRWLAIHESVS